VGKRKVKRRKRDIGNKTAKEEEKESKRRETGKQKQSGQRKAT
jgi:hypothetical protein